MTAALILTIIIAVVEAVGGWLTGSLALLSDAGHMWTDVSALGLALLAAWFAGRPANRKRTYGYVRLEILSALVNGVLLLAITVFIVVEALERLTAGDAGGPRPMALVATSVSGQSAGDGVPPLRPLAEHPERVPPRAW